MYDPTFIRTQHWHDHRIAVAKKTLAAIEAWQTEAQRRRDAAGLTAAAEAEKRACSASAELRDAILALDASTYRELAIQSAVVMVEWTERRSDQILKRLAELAGVEAYIDALAA